MATKTGSAVLSLLLVAVMLLSAGFTGVAGLALEESFIIKEKALPLHQKIDPAVKKAFHDNDYVEVLIKLTRQVDTGKTAHAAMQQTSRNRVAVRALVVDKLQENARKSQKGILQYLEREKDRGNVLECQSFFIVNIIYAKATPAVVENLSRRSDVKVILPNTRIYLDPAPLDDPGVIVETLAVEWGVSKVNAPSVWEGPGFEGSGVVVGIMDTGVYWQHEALTSKWRGYSPEDPHNPVIDYNWFDATIPGSTVPKDAHGHGTHVTGTVLGSAGSSRIGVAPGARWIAARIFDDEGKSTTAQRILSAGQFMIAPTDANGENPRPDLAPHIVNNSWGSSIQGQVDEWFRQMVQSWRSAQILPVFAAGNNGKDGDGSISHPANYPESLAVAATDMYDNLAQFSSRGPGYLPGIKPEISAPGKQVRSSIPGGYAEWSGTSMAAPHISGVAALMLSANPFLTVDELELLIKGTAVPLTNQEYPESPNYGFGYGLADAYAAVDMASEGIITGQVLGQGIDGHPPVISHRQVFFSTFLEYGFPLEVTVSDNVAVSGVKALVRAAGSDSWNEVTMYRYGGDHLNGDYWGQVSWELVRGSSLEYRFTAVDFTGNRTETESYHVTVHFGLQPGWSEDFEEKPVHWYRDGDWEWGIPATGPAPQFGGKVMGTNLTGHCTNDSESYLWAPPLDLRSADSPYLLLDHRYEIEEYSDTALVAITADYGESWNIYYFDGDSEGWQTDGIDLTPYKGKNQVYMVFILAPGQTCDGWYIDRVSLVENTRNTLYFSDFENPSSPEIGRPIPFRCSLQGPEPLAQPFYAPEYDLLPATAVLTVVETGKSAVTDPADGSYRLFHQETGGGEFTLLVTAEGYKPAQQTFTLSRGQTLVLNFVLQVDYLPGDVNNDQAINIDDAILVLKHITGLNDLPDREQQAADVNLNGVVDAADATLILGSIAGTAQLPSPDL